MFQGALGISLCSVAIDVVDVVSVLVGVDAHATTPTLTITDKASFAPAVHDIWVLGLNGFPVECFEFWDAISTMLFNEIDRGLAQ